jgi:hypothetical protein
VSRDNSRTSAFRIAARRCNPTAIFQGPARFFRGCSYIHKFGDQTLNREWGAMSICTADAQRALHLNFRRVGYVAANQTQLGPLLPSSHAEWRCELRPH